MKEKQQQQTQPLTSTPTGKRSGDTKRGSETVRTPPLAPHEVETSVEDEKRPPSRGVSPSPTKSSGGSVFESSRDSETTEKLTESPSPDTAEVAVVAAEVAVGAAVVTTVASKDKSKRDKEKEKEEKKIKALEKKVREKEEKERKEREKKEEKERKEKEKREEKERKEQERREKKDQERAKKEKEKKEKSPKGKKGQVERKNDDGAVDGSDMESSKAPTGVDSVIVEEVVTSHAPESPEAQILTSSALDDTSPGEVGGSPSADDIVVAGGKKSKKEKKRKMSPNKQGKDIEKEKEKSPKEKKEKSKKEKKEKSKDGKEKTKKKSKKDKSGATLAVDEDDDVSPSGERRRGKGGVSDSDGSSSDDVREYAEENVPRSESLSHSVKELSPGDLRLLSKGVGSPASTEGEFPSPSSSSPLDSPPPSSVFDVTSSPHSASSGPNAESSPKAKLSPGVEAKVLKKMTKKTIRQDADGTTEEIEETFEELGSDATQASSYATEPIPTTPSFTTFRPPPSSPLKTTVEHSEFGSPKVVGASPKATMEPSSPTFQGSTLPTLSEDKLQVFILCLVLIGYSSFQATIFELSYHCEACLRRV